MRYGLINDMRELDKSRLTQTVQRFVALGMPVTAPLPPATPWPKLLSDTTQQVACRKTTTRSDTAGNRLHARRRVWSGKQWPIEYYSELAQKLTQEGYSVWVLGSRKEHAIGETIRQAAGLGVQNLCGATDLVDTIDLLPMCRAAVSNDSGLMHIAAAVGIPLVAIYGSL